MRDRLAQRLLGSVLEWDDPELKNQQPVLDALARLKYDEYQQFKPGMKFIESLAIWLSQFKTIQERRIAYEFIRSQLIFISSSEMTHLVDLAYPNVIRPVLLKKVSDKLGIPFWKQRELSESSEYKTLRRRSLFLGLSDGARIDRFRRINKLDNEQIHSSYELSTEKVQGFVKDLRSTLAKYRHTEDRMIEHDEATFKTVFLLDDFSGSGMSLIRKEEDKFKGKIAKMYDRIFDIGAPLTNALDSEGFNVYVVIYIMTWKAIEYVQELITELWKSNHSICEVLPVMVLGDNLMLRREDSFEINSLINNYYDPSIEDRNTRVGKTKDVKYGFADVGLPLVLSHNTPNDSIFLLMADNDIHGLFPRISRHKEEI